MEKFQKKTDRKIKPGLVLLFLAPILGELISGHRTFLSFINPLNFLLLCLPYGLGALICRELVVRWKKGKMSLILLGIAYGIYEEWIVIRSIINPNWSELGTIGKYNFWEGINWTYGFMLIHFHVVISIVSSILLTEMIFPKEKNEKWLSNKLLILCGILFALWIPLGFFLSPGIPSIPLYILGILTMLIFVFAAYKIPKNIFKRIKNPIKKPRYFFILGFLNTTIIFVGTFFEGPKPPLFALFTILLLVDVLSFILILRWSQNGYGWTDKHKIALISGFLAFFILFSVIKDIESFSGASLVSIVSVYLLWKLYKTIKKRE
jgi:hypothetical protein